jgi:hypothetical protein
MGDMQDSPQNLLYRPFNIVSDGTNLYVSNDNTHTSNFSQIFKIDPSGNSTLFAGSLTRDKIDGDRLTSAKFDNIHCMAYSNNIIYVIDTNNVRTINITTGEVATMTLTSTDDTTLPYFCYGICSSSSGTLYITNHGSGRIFQVSNNVITTLITLPDGHPTKICFDGTNTIYFNDYSNYKRLFTLNLADNFVSNITTDSPTNIFTLSYNNGTIYYSSENNTLCSFTVATNTFNVLVGDNNTYGIGYWLDGSSTSAIFLSLTDIVATNNNIYVLDHNSSRVGIRQVSTSSYAVSTLYIPFEYVPSYSMLGSNSNNPAIAINQSFIPPYNYNKLHVTINAPGGPYLAVNQANVPSSWHPFQLTDFKNSNNQVFSPTAGIFETSMYYTDGTTNKYPLSNSKLYIPSFTIEPVNDTYFLVHIDSNVRPNDTMMLGFGSIGFDYALTPIQTPHVNLNTYQVNYSSIRDVYQAFNRTLTDNINVYLVNGTLRSDAASYTVGLAVPMSRTLTMIAAPTTTTTTTTTSTTTTTTAAPSQGPVCFLGNAPVATPRGPKRMDSLKEGDLVLTETGKTVAIQRISVQRHRPSPSTNPYVIRKGQYGATEELLISPRHKVATANGKMVEARDLGLKQKEMKAPFNYYNLELPGWANMRVAGVEVESLAPAKRIVATAEEVKAIIESLPASQRTAEAMKAINRICQRTHDGKIVVFGSIAK